MDEPRRLKGFCLAMLLLGIASLCPRLLGQSPGAFGGSDDSEQTVKKLVSAKRVYLMTAARDHGGNGILWGQKLADADAAMKELSKEVTKWGRFIVVGEDPTKADLVLLVMEWEDAHGWGKTVACRDQLFVFDGGQAPNEKSKPIWIGDAEKWGKWGGCSGAGQPIKELRKHIEKAEKNSH